MDVEERRRIRAEKEKLALEILKPCLKTECGSLDCVILVLRTANAIDILEKTFNGLRLSGTIVVYSAVQAVRKLF